MVKSKKNNFIVGLIVITAIISFIVPLVMDDPEKKSADRPRAREAARVKTVDHGPGKAEIPYPPGHLEGQARDRRESNHPPTDKEKVSKTAENRDVLSAPSDLPDHHPPPPPSPVSGQGEPVTDGVQPDLPEATRKVFMEEIEQLNFSIESAYNDMRNLDIRIDELRDDVRLAEDAYREARNNFDLGEIDEKTLNIKKEELEIGQRNVTGSEEMRDSKLTAIDHYRSRIEELERSLAGK